MSAFDFESPYSLVCRCDDQVARFWLLDGQLDRLEGDAHVVVRVLLHLKIGGWLSGYRIC